MKEDRRARPLISMIFPAFNEADNLKELHSTLEKTAQKLSDYDFEFIFVDDCSTDKTKDILEEIRSKDRRVEMIRLSRNFGAHAASSAGLRMCRGDAAFIIAADLQDRPEDVVPNMLKLWRQGYGVVWGIRDSRQEDNREGFKLFGSKIFYYAINRLTNVKQPASGVGTILMDSKAVDAFNQSSEKNSSITMLISWVGFPQTEYHYARLARHSGKSKWTLRKRFKLALDSVLAFSYTPIRFMSLVGFVCMSISIFYGIYLVMSRILNNITVPGWTTLTAIVLFIGGIQMMMLGVLGEYLWRTYDEARPRPQYIIERSTLEPNKSRDD